MPIIDGEKYACQSCIKGHRVSGCTHHDRELHHINPKGRPVKQCEHCRGARKSKSHHAKCDCGEKKDKDKQKDKGDAKGEHGADASVDDFSNHATVHDNECACHSGAKCICGVKPDSPDLKLDTSRQTLHAARTKPKLTSTHSESTLTVFANGHHKPCHRNNNTAHNSGLPYKIGRPHTLHGVSAFANYTKANSCGGSDTPAQRAMDTHSVSNNDYHTMFGSVQRSVVDSLPITPITGSLDTFSGMQDSLFTSQGSAYGFGGNSPEESQLSDSTSTQQWPWTNSVTPVNRIFGYGSLSTSPSQECLPNYDNDWAIPSAGLHNPSWSATDLPLDPGKLNDPLTQPVSHSGESHSNPGLTTASSSHSETGEPVLFGDLEIKNPPSVASESLFWDDNPVFRFAATSAPSDVSLAPTSMPAFVEDVLPAKDANTAPTSMPSSNPADRTSLYSTADFSAIAMPNTINEVPNDPWSMDQVFNGYDQTYPQWI